MLGDPFIVQDATCLGAGIEDGGFFDFSHSHTGDLLQPGKIEVRNRAFQFLETYRPRGDEFIVLKTLIQDDPDHPVQQRRIASWCYLQVKIRQTLHR